LDSAWFVSLKRHQITGILDVILYRYLVADMVLEIFSSLDPAIVKTLITGLATTIAKVGAESGLKMLGKGGDKLLDGTGNLTQQAIDLLIPIAQKYFENYAKRHGEFKILGMNKPLSIESVYTQVNFHPDAIQAHQSPDAVEKAFRGRSSRNDDRRAGMEVANTHQYLMILGGPGTGKTTFLRKVGLEAIKNSHGEYSHASIPVFLELRSLQWKAAENIDLEAKIAAEFEHCGLLEATVLTRKLLERGKLLILFDGLDEVPPEFMKQMTTAIKNLVDQYAENRVIASCRIAAYRNYQNFNRFTDVVIADFDEKQIQFFINNWFKSHDRSEWGQECWLRLTSDDNKATIELAKTPLLLTLVCILFLKQGEFPTKRATLYDRAVSTLLSEWDASKEIVRQQPYKGLDLKCKEVMLAEIAYSNFTENNLFFQRGEISNQIKEILFEMLTEEKRINGRDVLDAIEEQHGILVKRYNDIYSFSHLTLQEFFTAKHIIDNNLNLPHLVAKYIGNIRFREVFLLLAGLRNADDLLMIMECHIRTYISTPKLQNLLVWVDKFTDPTTGNIKPVGKRALAIAYAIAKANIDRANVNDYVNTIDIANAIANTNGIVANSDNYAYLYAYTYTYANYTNYSNANTSANANAYVVKHFCKYARWALDFEIYRGLDLEQAIEKLEKLKSHIQDKDHSVEIGKEFAQKFIPAWLTVFHLTPEIVDLSKDEIKILDNYLSANLLLIECEKAAVRRSPEVWSQIQDRMLRPG
jgi:hypothetical protein